MQLDLLMQICARADNKTIEVLSHTAFWGQIRLFAGDNHFWYMRVEHETCRTLDWRPDLRWKELYYLIRYKKDIQILLDQDATIADVVEQFCSDSRRSDKSIAIFRDCCHLGLENLVRDLIHSTDIPAREVTMELESSRIYDRTSIASILLDSGEQV